MVRRITFISLFAALIATVGLGHERSTTHTFHFQEHSMRAVLDSLFRWYGVPMVYLEKDVEGRNVTADCRACTFEEALRSVLAGTDVFALMVGEQVLLQVRRDESPPPRSILAGLVTDSLTGEALVGASVLLRSEQSHTIVRWGMTNEHGFFSLPNILPGRYALEIRSIGYDPRVVPLSVRGGATMVGSYALLQEDVVLAEITVEGERSLLTGSEGIARGLYIRAAPADQNQYFLEGTRIYNPSHYAGVMSAFNTDALRDVHLVAGGVPPYYGGRIGGILDVMMKNGNDRRILGTGTIGTLSSAIVLEGPIAHRTSIAASMRKGYPELLLARRPGLARSDLHVVEGMGKLIYTLDNSALSLAGYFNRDTYNNTVTRSPVQSLENDFRWRNTAFHLRWFGTAAASLFFQTSAAYSLYSFGLRQRLIEGGIPVDYPSSFFIEDLSLRAHAEYFYDEYHTVRGGVELVHHGIGSDINDFTSQLAPLTMTDVAPWELSVYVQDQWRLVPSVTAELGARGTSFIGRLGTFSALDPRFSLLIMPSEDFRIYSSFSAVTQFVHPYRHSGVFVFMPSIFFYPSTERVQPTTSLHASLGFVKALRQNTYVLTVETYYRQTQKLHDFAFDTTLNAEGQITDALLFGEGTVYGGEVTITKRIGTVTGILRYSLSWTRHHFAEINAGAAYKPRFAREHEFFLSLGYNPTPNWTFGIVALLSSDQSTTVERRRRLTLSESPSHVREVSAEITRYSDQFDLNGGRIPGFERLELFGGWKFIIGDVGLHVMLRMVNGYGLLEPFSWSILNDPDSRLRWRVVLDPPPLFPLYPVVSVRAWF